MRMKVGLRIDHRNAVIVILTEKGEESKLIITKEEKQLALQKMFSAQTAPSGGGSKARLTGTLNIYYDAVIACIRHAESVLIFGSGESKEELEKRIEKSNLSGRIVGIETVDVMTDHQVAAKVRQYFQGNIGQNDNQSDELCALSFYHG